MGFVKSMLLFILMTVFLFNCQKNNNTIINYFNDVEIQYETQEQKESIRTALKDILELRSDELQKRKYSDYIGRKNQWDLPTLI